jgi:hypothetical protein
VSVRRPLLLVGAALLAARASAAFLAAPEAAPAASAAAASAAAGAVSAPLPLSYVARLAGPSVTLSAAPAFLADRGAQAWLLKNRPEAYPSFVARALELSDWRKTFAAHDDPRQLREALLARADDPLGASPAALLALAGRDPVLAKKRRLLEVAALEWNGISEETRAILLEQGRDEESWSSLPLPERYDAVRAAHEAFVARTVTAAPGTPEFAAQYERALLRVRALMTDEEREAREAELARAKAVADALARAERAVADAGGAGAALLASARGGADLDEASARVNALLESLGQNPAPLGAAREPSLDLSPAERAEFSARMADAFAAELSGAPIGREILDALRESPAVVRVGALPSGNAASYSPARNEIVVSERELAVVAAGLGRSPRDLLTDEGLRRDAALFFAPFFVHEGQHHRQYMWARSRGLRGPYSQQWEHEAYAAQAAFIRQKRRAAPRLAQLQSRLSATSPSLATELNLPDSIDRAPVEHRVWLARTYRTAPTLARAGAKIIAAGVAAAAEERGTLRTIEAELAARRRLDPAARARLEADGFAEGRTGWSAASSWSTSALRLMRRRLLRRADDALELAGELMDRSLSEIRRLEAARGPAEPDGAAAESH